MPIGGKMTDLILQQAQENSPFDSIKRFDSEGHECWYGRELMILLGYQKWQRFEDVIERAAVSCENSDNLKALHFKHLPGSVSGYGRQGDNYRLSRFACHLIAMNGDPRKKEIAAAQRYFSAKTREAETIIPSQIERIRELELELDLRKAEQKLIDTRHLIVSTCPKLLADRILGVTVEKEIEYIDRTITSDGERLDGCGITYLQKRYGFKSTSATWAWLDSIGLGKESGHWHNELVGVTRQVLPRGLLDKLDDLSQTGLRQRFFGE
jgi:DNA-damage-inducible protein D